MIVQKETITPDIAKEYLSHNIINRPLRSKVVESLMRDMKNGNFVLTHQGIAFDSNGNLIDGQHRLTACALANVPFETLVARDVNEEAITHLDKGNKRTFTDALYFEESDPMLRSTVLISVIRNLVRHGYNGSLILTDDEITALLDAFPTDMKNIYKVYCIKSYKSRAGYGAAGLAALMCGEPVDGVDKFLRCLLAGDARDCEAYNISAALALAHQMDKSIGGTRRATETALYSLTSNALWLFLHGNPTKLIKPTKSPRYDVFAKLNSVLGAAK